MNFELFLFVFGVVDKVTSASGIIEAVSASSYGDMFVWDARNVSSVKVVKEYKIEEDYDFISAPSIGDIDGDGYGEIVIRSPQYLHAYRYNGAHMNNFPATVEWQDTLIQDSAPQSVIADLNDDGIADIVTGSKNGLLKAFSGDGENLIRFPLSIGSDVKSTPCVADLDGDGDIELIAVSDDNYLYVWDFPTEYDEDNVYWSGYLNGISHYAHMRDISAQTPQVPEELLVGGSVYNYPNPTEGRETAIHFIVSKPADITIKIYDMSGQVVDELSSGMQAQPMIDNEIEWNLDGIESGVYMARVEAVSDDGKREHSFCKIAVIK